MKRTKTSGPNLGWEVAQGVSFQSWLQSSFAIYQINKVLIHSRACWGQNLGYSPTVPRGSPKDWWLALGVKDSTRQACVYPDPLRTCWGLSQSWLATASMVTLRRLQSKKPEDDQRARPLLHCGFPKGQISSGSLFPERRGNLPSWGKKNGKNTWESLVLSFFLLGWSC